MDVQWFPGHMAKTRRVIQSNLKLVDAVAELCDARIPFSSRNPEMNRLVGGKPRLLLLNKCDCADARATAAWLEYYKGKGETALAVDCRSGKNVSRVVPALMELLRAQIARWNDKGMTGRPVRVMIVGIPNVGKSSLINRLAGARIAGVADKPGVTRGKQWISLEGGQMELLDMPGVLPPRFDDKSAGEKLAFTGAVKDDILDAELMASRLLQMLSENYPQALTARYGISLDGLPEEDMTGCSAGYELLLRIGRKRGFLVSGGDINTERSAITVIDEYRGGKIGRFTLELPEGGCE